MNERQLRIVGVAAIVVGGVLLFAGSFWAHFTGLPERNALGDTIYPAIPRGWGWVLIGQMTALVGSQLAIGGAVLALLYGKTLTWARASIGAALFTIEMIILFGIIPNEWLTLTQSTFAWTPQKIAFTVPAPLVLNNEVAISYAAIKDAVSGGYVVVVLGAVAIAMVQWQKRQQRLAAGPPPAPISTYGRPVTKLRSTNGDR